LANLYTDSLVLIRYHWYYPSTSDPYYQYNITENMARNNYYGNNYSPHLFVDGNIDAGYNTGLYGTRIRNEMALSAPLDIQIEGDFDPTPRTGQLRITVAATDQITNTNLKLRVGLIESRIYWSAPNGTQWHEQTFRDMIPGTAGTPLTIQRGQILQFTQSFNCPAPLNWGNCEIVVFVQSDTGRRILQGAKRTLSSMVYTVNHFNLIAPENQDTIGTTNPQFIWSSSADPDSGYQINYQVYVSTSPEFIDATISDPIADTSWDCPVPLQDDTLLYWKVVADNGHAPQRMSDQIFTLFINGISGCPYLPGDINGNGVANGLDVTFAVTYFKGGAAPPNICDCRPDVPAYPFYAAGDVNGNCVFNGVDISYMVGFFWGGPGITSCPSCPPMAR